MSKLYRLTIQTSNDAATVEGSALPTNSQDGRLRLVWSTDAVGRGVSITVQPLSAETQFVIHQMMAVVIPSQAGPDDS